MIMFWCFGSLSIKFLLNGDIFMYFYSSKNKIMNILLITSGETPKKQHVQAKYV